MGFLYFRNMSILGSVIVLGATVVLGGIAALAVAAASFTNQTNNNTQEEARRRTHSRNNRQDETRHTHQRQEVHPTHPINNTREGCYTHQRDNSLRQEQLPTCSRNNRQNEVWYTQPSCSRLEDVARIAHSAEGVTHLLTNENKLYCSTQTQHAEILFTKAALPYKTHTIWIKNSPCARCSKVLINFFSNNRKPKIYFGRIYRLDDDEDREGLIDLLQNGFELEVWETLHTMMYGSHNRTAHKYLRQVKQEAQATYNMAHNHMYMYN